MRNLMTMFLKMPENAQRTLWRAMLGLLLGLLVACSPSYTASAPDVAFTEVNAEQTTKPEIEALIAPYKNELDARMNEVLAISDQELTKAYPEGLLNNFVADMMLVWGRKTLDEKIDFAIVNNGGLRIPLPAGEITLGHIYELMPFDNTVVVLTLAPEQMQEFLEHIGKGSEASVGGMTMEISNEKASRVMIGGKPLDPTRSYRLITIDYLAGGGSNMTFMKTRTEYRDTEMFMRDFIANYLRNETKKGRHIRSQLDGRIVIN